MAARQLGFRSLAIALVAVGLVSLVPAVHADDAATYHECYRSIRSCQKTRCGHDTGSTQVSCMRECNKEYETCVGGAGGGTLGGVLGIPEKLSTPTTKERKRDVRRQQRQQE